MSASGRALQPEPRKNELKVHYWLCALDKYREFCFLFFWSSGKRVVRVLCLGQERQRPHWARHRQIQQVPFLFHLNLSTSGCPVRQLNLFARQQ